MGPRKRFLASFATSMMLAPASPAEVVDYSSEKKHCNIVMELFEINNYFILRLCFVIKTFLIFHRKCFKVIKMYINILRCIITLITMA